MRPEDFVFLEVHSAYSLGEGTMTVASVVEAAKERGASVCALTDDRSFAGVVAHVQACAEAGLSPLVGCRIGGALLLATSMEDYARLSSLVTGALADEGFDLLRALAEGRHGNSLVISDDEAILRHAAGEVWAGISPWRPGWADRVKTGRRLGRPCVAVPPAYFRRPEDYATHRALRAIRLRKNPWELAPGDVQSPRAWLLDPRSVREEIFGRLESMPEILEATVRIAARCRFDFRLGELRFPSEMPNAPAVLRAACLENLPKRYADPTVEVVARLEHELTVIETMGFSEYFLVVADLVREGGRYTCGRGSGAASLVSYLLFITHVDPIRHRLYFERFLNLERKDPPDIDVDFAWDERDRVTDYAARRWGERCALVSNHITYSGRNALREAARHHGRGDDEIEAAQKILRHESPDRLGEPWPAILDLARRLRGLPRHLSLHCGGLLVTPRPVREYVPLYPSTKPGVRAIQWEKDQAEDFGLVKIDILGNRSLAVVRDAIARVNELHGTSLAYEFLDPLEDPETKRMIALGDTMGVFYVESPAMRLLQRRARSGDYDRLVVHSSIIRPAANDYIREYLRRLHGGEWEPLVPEMAELMEESFGIMVYQEDISRLAVRVGGFTVGEGEELRKVIGSPRKAKRKEELRRRLAEAMRRRGDPEETVAKIWDMIESFSGYSFCKPHSASYAQLSFKAAWLKAHHPAEFMAAVLANRGGFYVPAAYVSEARRRGVVVEPPDVNRSRLEWLAARGVITAGFSLVKGLDARTAEAILRERAEGGPFRSFEEFLRRTGVTRAEARLLVLAGAFRHLEDAEVPELMWRLIREAASTEVAFRPAGRAAKGKGAQTEFRAEGGGGADLSSVGRSGVGVRTLSAPAVLRGGAARPRRESELETMAREREAFGFVLSFHPMRWHGRFAPAPGPGGRVWARDLGRHRGKTIRMAGLLVTYKTVETKKNRNMRFVTFEDETGLIETVLFPDVYDRYVRILSMMEPYVLRGKVETEFDVDTLTVLEIEALRGEEED